MHVRVPMLQGWFVVATALGYIGLLFVVASYGDRLRARARGGWMRTLIYPLSLAIYCTSWTFFGSVGFASRTGYDFLTIYVGPILLIGLGWPLLLRVVRLAKAQNITSIADFIAARYGKNPAVAATVTLIAIVGTVPYIALQLKAVSASLGTILAHVEASTGVYQPAYGDLALFVALAMFGFAILFGTRHIDATEHQAGLILAVAAESMVKLIAFLAVGVFVTYVMFGGPSDLFARAMERPDIAAVLTGEPQAGSLLAMTLVSFAAVLLLPRQFHVAVVENNDETEVRRAAWLFPLYLVLINLFVLPIAVAGLLSFAAIAQLAPAFFGGLIWRRGTARGAIAGMTIGILAWIYTLLLPSFAQAGLLDASIVTHGPWGIAALRPQALLGLHVDQFVHGVAWSLILNVIAYVAFSLHREPASIERLQANLFFPPELAPVAPSFLQRRASVTVGEISDTVARYLGDQRTRSAFASFAAARGLILDPAAEADFHLLHYAEHLLASAIGAASSRLVLSLLLRKRTVSTKAALKLLDDANAAIQYNREILQTALDHVRQGIAVFNKELQLICWNRYFGEILNLPPELVRIGCGLDRLLQFEAH